MTIRKIPILGSGWLALALITVTALYAGQPTYVSNTGVAFKWDLSQGPVPFNPDGGALGTLDNAAAIAFVEGSFQRWADVPGSAITFANMGQITDADGNPTDINETNYDAILSGDSENGQNEIVFDELGQIFEDIFGANSRILGFASVNFVTTEEPFLITEALAFLNGGWIDGDSSNAEISIDEFEAVFVHEFGHYINLAHSQVNGKAFRAQADVHGFGVPPATSIETMYPILLDVSSASPHADDIATLTFLYPAVISSKTNGAAGGSGVISGKIFLSDGTTPATGVNVVARNRSGGAATFFDDAVSQVSGSFYEVQPGSPAGVTPDPQLDGAYTLNNLTPGAEYSVEINELLPFGQGSDFPTTELTPLPAPEEFYNGAAESADSTADDPDDFTLLIPQADAPLTGIDIIFNEAPFPLLVTRSDGTPEFVASVQSLITSPDTPNGASDYAAVRFSIPASVRPPFTVKSATFLNNDGQTVWPRILLTEGTTSGQPDLQNILAEKTNFSSVASLANMDVPFGVQRTDLHDVYFVIQFPQDSAIADVGAGPAIGGDGSLDLGYVPGNLHSTDGVNFVENSAVSDIGGIGALNWTVTLNIAADKIGIDALEPNGDTGTATPISYGETRKGTIDPAAELDYFKFTGSAGDTIQATVTAKPYGSALDGFLALVDANGDTVFQNDDQDLGVIQDPKLQAVLPANGDYYLIMDSFENSAGLVPMGSPGHFYELSLDTFSPPLEPNDGVATATPIDTLRAISAALDVTGDIDFFSFTGIADKNLTASLTLPGFTNFVPLITLFDVDGSTVLQTASDRFLQSKLPSNGTYFLSIADVNGGGGAEYFYDLQISLTDLFLPTPGNLRIVSSRNTVNLSWEAPGGGSTVLASKSSATPAVDEVEPNNASETAQELIGPSPVVVNGNAELADEGVYSAEIGEGIDDDFEDLFRLFINTPGLSLTLTGMTDDCDLWLLDDPPTESIDVSYNSGPANEAINQPNLLPGSYVIAVSIAEGFANGPESPYTLTATGDIAGGINVQSYNIYRSQTSGAFTSGNVIKTVDGSTTAIADSNLTTGLNYFYQVTAVYAEGESLPSNEVSALITSVSNGEAIPADYALKQNYPNPFNPTTIIEYAIPAKHKQQKVVVEIYNLVGQKVRTLVDANQTAKYYAVEWDGRNDIGTPVTSGLYIYRIKAGSFVETRKMLLVK